MNRRASVVFLLLAGGCGEERPVVAAADAAPEGAAPILVDAGPLPLEPIICGDASCPPPGETAPFGEACCLPDGSCGLTAGLLSSECHQPGSPGSLDTTCAERRLPGGTLLPGCCTDDGRCGSWDPRSGLGCVPGGVGAQAPRADAAPDAGLPECRFDPSADCTELASLPCDGPEDCSDGRQCCGRIQGGRLDRFECLDSCRSPSDRRAGVWLALCHPGDACLEPGFTCSQDPALPFLARCYAGGAAASDAGALDASFVGEAGWSGVRCGAATCGADETCCLRGPREPYCGPASVPCACSGPP